MLLGLLAFVVLVRSLEGVEDMPGFELVIIDQKLTSGFSPSTRSSSGFTNNFSFSSSRTVAEQYQNRVKLDPKGVKKAG